MILELYVFSSRPCEIIGIYRRVSLFGLFSRCISFGLELNIYGFGGWFTVGFDLILELRVFSLEPYETIGIYKRVSLFGLFARRISLIWFRVKHI